MCAHLFIHIAGRAHQSTEMSYKTSIISVKCLFMFSTRTGMGMAMAMGLGLGKAMPMERRSREEA